MTGAKFGNPDGKHTSDWVHSLLDAYDDDFEITLEIEDGMVTYSFYN